MTIEGVAGVTLIEDKVAVVTVKVAVPDWPPKVALITADPWAAAVAKPVALIVALALELFQTVPPSAVTVVVDPSV